MRKLVLLVAALAFIACGDDNKKSDPNKDTANKDVQKEVPKDEPIVDLESFLKANNKPNTADVSVDFGGKFDISEFSIYTDSISYYVFKVDAKDPNFESKNYRIALRLRPHGDDADNLLDASKERKIDYDNLYSGVQIKEANGNKFIVFPVDTKIKDYRKIEALLYDTTIKGYLPGNFEIDYGMSTFLSNLKEKDGAKADAELGRLLTLKKVYAYDSKKSKGVSIILNTENYMNADELSNFKLSIRTFPFEEQKGMLKESSKKEKTEYDSWYFDLNMITLNGKNYIASFLETPMLEFKKVEFRLYDKNQKRYIGIPVAVDDVYADGN